MEKFNKLKSIPSYLALQNIDTDMITSKPKSFKAQTACSLDEPQPKFSFVTSICEF